MKEYGFMIFLILVMGIGIVHMTIAHADGSFDEAKAIIDSNIPCDQLTDKQLEIMGDYYMEQMHPGPSHERMDEMMGGEGSASLAAMHRSMALKFYCQSNGSSKNFGMMGGGMMDGGMMGSDRSSSQQTCAIMGNKHTGCMMASHEEMKSHIKESENDNVWVDSRDMFEGRMTLSSVAGWLILVALSAFVFGIVFWWTGELMQRNGKKKS